MTFTEYCNKHYIKNGHHGAFIRASGNNFRVQEFVTGSFRGEEKGFFYTFSNEYNTLESALSSIKARKDLHPKLVFKKAVVVNSDESRAVANQVIKENIGSAPEKDSKYIFEKYKHMIGEQILCVRKARDGKYHVVTGRVFKMSGSGDSLGISNVSTLAIRDDKESAIENMEDRAKSTGWRSFKNPFEIPSDMKMTNFERMALANEKVGTWRERRDARRKENAA